MKRFLLAAMFLSVMSNAQRPEGRPNGGPGPFGPPMAESDRAAFKACLAKKNVSLPESPQLSEQTKAGLKACHEGSPDREAFQSCISSKGITKPEVPHMSREQMQAMHECREELHK